MGGLRQGEMLSQKKLKSLFFNPPHRLTLESIFLFGFLFFIFGIKERKIQINQIRERGSWGTPPPKN
jgi:hypothetical protein